MQREHRSAREIEPAEDGFTLLELMMVILIIGILIAVLTPTFLGASTRAKDRAAQANLRSALTGAKSWYLGTPDYTGLNVPAGLLSLKTDTGGLTFLAAASAPSSNKTISVNGVSASQVIISGRSTSGSCFYIFDDEVNGTTQFATLAGGGGCAANGIVPPPVETAWKATW
jgi:type IV pilus assembly protein PilA